MMTDTKLIDKWIAEVEDRLANYDDKRDGVYDAEARNSFSRLSEINRHLLSIAKAQQRRISQLEDVLQDHVERRR